MIVHVDDFYHVGLAINKDRSIRTRHTKTVQVQMLRLKSLSPAATDFRNALLYLLVDESALITSFGFLVVGCSKNVPVNAR